MRSRGQLAAAGVLCSLCLGWSQPARAAGDDGLDQVGTTMWVISVAEFALLGTLLGLGALSALGGGRGSGDLGLGLVGTPLILGIGAGYASMQDDWDPHIAGAMHQGLWTGAALTGWGVLLGQQIDESSPWPSVAMAVGLGALGVLGGAAVGGLLVDSENEMWMVYAAPVASGAAVLVTWLTLLVMEGATGEPPLEDRALATTLVAAATAPLLVGTLGVVALSVMQAIE
ncbi:MAG: hypothetical protein ABIJ09_22075 [Pseudomonadota bacterium]